MERYKSTHKNEKFNTEHDCGRFCKSHCLFHAWDYITFKSTCSDRVCVCECLIQR
uniref:Uncharacterized protein n=1 Tax=Anguilla anguilla TaxID=7936 RepID=A0A0E9XSM7_ANGAN